MEIRIVIDAPKGWKRRALLLCGAFFGLIAVPAVIAHAYDTSWIVAGQPVSASALAADLNEAQQRIAALEGAHATETMDGGYSVNAIYCGSTASNYDGSGVGGYSGGKAKCQAVAGCSARAHMCTAEEMVRTEAVLATIPSVDAWYSHGLPMVGNSAGAANYDCDGWSNNSASVLGSMWYPPQHRPTGDNCNNAHPIACCQ